MLNSYDRRQMMIDQTGAWLTWALDNDVQTPRIPTRRVDEGGFGILRQIPGARVAFARWWAETINYLERL